MAVSALSLCFSKHHPLFRVLTDAFLVISQNWGVDSGIGQLHIPRCRGPHDGKLIPVWGWGTSNPVEVSDPRGQLGFFFAWI